MRALLGQAGQWWAFGQVQVVAPSRMMRRQGGGLRWRVGGMGGWWAGGVWWMEKEMEMVLAAE